MDLGLKDKVVVVTGGASGIGAEIARRLSASGARIALWDLDQGAAEQLAELNHTGMQLYQEGKFQEAIVIFEQALTVAPTNTGAALNLIQSLLQVLESQQKQKSLAIYQRCRQTFKLIEHAHLPERHQQRYTELQTQYQQYRQELKQSS